MNVFDKAREKAIKSYINRIKAIMDKYTEEYCKIAPTGAFDPSKPFSFEDYPATLSKVKSLEAKLAKEMRVTVEDGIRDSWAMSNDKNDQLVRSTLSVEALDGMSEAAVRRYFNQNSGLLDAFMTRRVGGMNLSQRVWRITEQNQQEMENAIDIALRDGTDAGTLSRNVRRLLNEPDRLFRRVRDEHGVLHLSKAAKAFHPGRGVYRSSYKNAMRLAGTEINIAYRTADYARYQQLDFIVGVEVVTSPTNHPEPDICDELKGRYPKDFKFTGWHPNCRCHVETILKTEQEMDADDAAIRSGGRPSTGSVNTVKDMPDQFERWLQDNEERIARANSLPYFLRDNYTITPGADGTLAFERIVAQPAAPRKKLQNEKTEERWADLTNSQRKEYVLKWIQDERVVNKEFDNYLKKTGFIKNDIVITEEGYFDEKTHSILSLAKKRIIDNELKIYNHYVGTSESFDINRALYTNKGLLPKELFEKNAISKTQLETINALDESIQNSKIGIPMMAYRMSKKDEIKDVFGVDIDMFLSNDEIARRISERGTGVNYGFTSASTNPDLNAFQNRPFIYEINIPKGSRCYVTENSYESEIILPRQSKYKINSVRYDNELGKVVINVDVKNLDRL